MINRLSMGEYLGSAVCRYDRRDVVVSETRYTPGSLPDHQHAAQYLCVVMEGAFTEYVGSRADECERGTLVLHPQGEVHRDEFHTAGECLNAEVPARWVDDEPTLRRTAARRVVLQSPRALELARELRREMTACLPASGLAIDGLVLQLLATASREERAGRRGGVPLWLLRASEELRESPREGKSIDELAAAAGVHPSHFVRVFRRQFGCTPAAFVRRLQIERAMVSLADESMSLSQIAADCGYYDHAHFTRAFRRAVGTTPSGYRSTLSAARTSHVAT